MKRKVGPKQTNTTHKQRSTFCKVRLIRCQRISRKTVNSKDSLHLHPSTFDLNVFDCLIIVIAVVVVVFVVLLLLLLLFLLFLLLLLLLPQSRLLVPGLFKLLHPVHSSLASSFCVRPWRGSWWTSRVHNPQAFLSFRQTPGSAAQTEGKK